MLGIFYDWAKGRYKEIPSRTLIAVIGALIYFVSPVDALLDWIPFAGFLDDATVIGFVIASLRKDLVKYKKWKQETND